MAVAELWIDLGILEKLIDLEKGLDAERYDESKTNLEGNLLGTGFNTCVGPDARAPLRDLHSGRLDTRVDTRPRTSLSVGLVYIPTIVIALLFTPILTHSGLS